FQAEDGIRDLIVTGVQTCALPILRGFTVSLGFSRAEADLNLVNKWKLLLDDLLQVRKQSYRIYCYRSELKLIARVTKFYYVESRSEERRVGKECRLRCARAAESRR